MVLLQPEQGVGNQKLADFVASIVKDQRTPVAVLALARIGVFVKRCAVEIHQAVRIFWKMRGDPIHKNRDPFLMAAVHQIHEVFRRPETGSRRVVTDQLVTPGAGERVLHDGKKLQVRVAHALGVSHQRFGHFAVSERLPVRAAEPALGVHLVNRDGLA